MVHQEGGADVVCADREGSIRYVKSSSFVYRKLRADLEDMGFEVNPYGPCVATYITGS